nr:hypothetical protein [uncultured Oscillibacter sp.]
MPRTNLPTLTAPDSRPRARPGGDTDGLALSTELLDGFLDFLTEHGRTPETVKTYRVKLYQLYDWLPKDKRICRGTLEEWRKALLDSGYAPRTVNLCISAANSLLEVHGHRELQIGKPLEPESDIQPELTRTEYLRLLSTARTLGKEREYLMVKVFAATGISVRDLPRLTVEAAQAGKIKLPASVVHIPDCLGEELLDYAKRKGISSGPLFVTRSRVPYTRNGVTSLIQRLCADARVPEEKANPRCLKKLYQSTQASIQANIALLVEQSHDRLLETEQLSIGWKQEEVSIR